MQAQQVRSTIFTSVRMTLGERRLELLKNYATEEFSLRELLADHRLSTHPEKSAKSMRQKILADHRILTNSFIIMDEVYAASFDIQHGVGQCRSTFTGKIDDQHQTLAQRRAKGILSKLDTSGISVISEIKEREIENSPQIQDPKENVTEILAPKREEDWIVFNQARCRSVVLRYLEDNILIFRGMLDPDSSYSRDVAFRNSSLSNASIARDLPFRGLTYLGGEGDFLDGDQHYSGFQGFLLSCIRRTEAYLGASAGKFYP